MATSGSKSVTVTQYDTLKFTWSVSSQSIANNTSTVAWKLQLITTGYGRIDSTKAKSYTIKVNGTSYTGTNYIGIGNNSTKTLVSGTTTIKHNTDGSKTFSYSFKQEFNITFSGTKIEYKSGSGTGTLNNIPRAATITAAPNFTDEDNPTITYSNPAGTAVTSLQACISFDGSDDDIAYRDISKTGTSYTFNLTDAEREVLINATTAKSRTVKFYIKTVLGGNNLYNSVSKTLTIANAEPALEPTAYDSGEVSITLTGDAENKVIKGYNIMNVAANATAKKNASITSYKISNGGKSLSDASGKLSGVETGEFVFTITDSRGYTVSKTLNKTLIDYIKPTCNMSLAAPTTDGDVSVNISGIYFNGSFGAVNNSLRVCVRYKANSGDYCDWVEGTATLNNNAYNATIDISGLDYRSTYTFEAMAADAIYNGDTEPFIYSATRTVKTMPVFDWGSDDFNFNVPVNVEGDITADSVSVEGSVSGSTADFSGAGTFGSVVSNGAVSGTNASFTGTLTASGTATLKDSRGKTLTGGERVTNIYTSSATSVSTSTDKIVTLLTAPVAGLYIVTLTASWASNATGIRACALIDKNKKYLSASRIYAGGTGAIQQNTTGIIYLAKGETVRGLFWQNSGSTINLSYYISQAARIGA